MDRREHKGGTGYREPRGRCGNTVSWRDKAMIRKIQSEYLIAEINELGAELFSLKSKRDGTEYLWQGNPEYWPGRSTVLFPICARLYEGRYFYRGKEYEMPIHGIAKLFEFHSEKNGDSEISLTLKSSPETKSYYPFDFEFAVRYSLNGNELKTEFEVKNTGCEVMYFSYGGHPGFNVPFSPGESFEDYYLEFEREELTRLLFSESCFYTGRTEKYPIRDKKLPLRHALFDNDAIFFESEAEKVRLKSRLSKRHIEVSYGGMTSLGLWHKPKSDAPYICIEPWHGIPSLDGVADDFEKKAQMIALNVNKSYKNSYKIKIFEE